MDANFKKVFHLVLKKRYFDIVEVVIQYSNEYYIKLNAGRLKEYSRIKSQSGNLTSAYES